MDEYIEKLLEMERQKNKKKEYEFRQTNDAWQEFMYKQNKELQEVIPDNWNEELDDLKALNKQQLNDYIHQSPDKEQLLLQSENRYEPLVLKLAEDDILQQNISQIEESIFNEKENFDNNASFKDYEFHPQVMKQDQILDSLNAIQQNIKHMQEYEIEMERLTMEREDRLSLQYEEYCHRLKFMQKDMSPPILPIYLTDANNNPLKNKPVAKNPIPNNPMTDNFIKYRITGLQIPQKIDLNSVKILYSRAKEEEEEERQRQEEIERLRQLEHKRLIELVNFSKSAVDSLFDKPQTNNLAEALQKFSKAAKPTAYKQCVQESKIEVKLSLGKDFNPNKLFNNVNEIYQSHLLKVHNNQKQSINPLLNQLEKMLSSKKQCEDPRPVANKKVSNKNQDIGFNEDFMKLPDINMGGNADSELGQALELHAPDQQKSDKIEIKNENWNVVDISPLNSYKNLIHLNLSMNKIMQISGSLDCPLLTQLRLSDNQIKEINPQMLSRCLNLKVLNMDINQIRRIQNVGSLVNLEELSISNNQIQSMDGLQNLAKLRRLNLSFNKIINIDGLNNLHLLEYLELGKNFISNVESLINNSNNKFLFLNELYLYSNSLVSFPKELSFPQLKIMNLNRNQDLGQISIAYCPLLETLNASYCSLVIIKNLISCPSLKELDISFNQIQTLESFLGIIKFNKQLRNLRFNDNPFSTNKEGQFDQYLQRLLNFLERVNGDSINFRSQPKHDEMSQEFKNYISNISEINQLRQFFHRIMSQKIRVTFFSTTDIMKYYRQIISFNQVQQLMLHKNDKQNNKNTCLRLMRENHELVNTLRSSVKVITRFMRKRRVKRKALLKRMTKYEDKIIKIQALIKGAFIRNKHNALITRIKTQSVKKTKKYQQISKLQANIKGYLFRKRRLKALSNLKKKNDLDLEDEDFDADKFFGIKPENFESGLSLPQEQMMQQMIAMMANSKQMMHRQQQQPSDSVKFPPINKNQTITSNMNDMIKPKTMIGQNNQMVKTNNEYFYNQGNKQNRPPSARSNAISEIEMRSDHQSIKGSNFGIGQRKNNYLQQSNLEQLQQTNPHRMPSIGPQSNVDDSDKQSIYSMRSNPFYPAAAQQYIQKVADEKKKELIDREQKIAEWGFQNEETKKLLEARMKKQQNIKNKKKVLTADEKYQKFIAQNKKK